MEHLQQIFNKLNLSKSNGLFITAEYKWKNTFSNRVERLIENVIKPDAFFCIDNKPFVLFFENVKNKELKLKEIWNFNEAPIAIIVSEGDVEIYNGYNFLKENSALQIFDTEALNDFGYFKLVTGETWSKYANDFSYTNRVDFHLLNNIKTARERMKDNFQLDLGLANSLIGKTIFVRYLIDRRVKLNFDGELRLWSTAEFCEILNSKLKAKQFFEYLKEKFNGDLFPISKTEFENIPKGCFQILINLLKGEEVSSGQTSLFDLYDFAIIPVEFISNIYELFIGESEQEEQGAYYTPLFLVDYILHETIESKIQNNGASSAIRVLDPACGSGIFLVETLRKIIEKYTDVNSPKSTRSQTYKEKLKQLVIDNIFGIDKDKNAVEVAIFSIYLTLLDYQRPSDIETFKFPMLLNKNFFVADFFDEDAEFNKILSVKDFDFIIGNPPWKRGNGDTEKSLYSKYVKNRRTSEGLSKKIQISISNNEIAQAFVLRVSDFCCARTKLALVVTSKMFYNIYAKDFRAYLLDQYFIHRVFELAPVRKHVFDKSYDSAVGPASVIFYQYANGKDTDHQIVEHITLKPNRFFSLFKVFTIQRNDFKRIEQGQLKTYDYLWKVLVYGNYLDFNLINKLKSFYKPIDSIIRNENFTISQGVIIGRKNRNDDVSELIGLPFLDTKTDIKQFWINETSKKIWLERFVHRSRSGMHDIFKGPALLITGGVSKDLRSVSAFSNGGYVFKSSLTAIRGNDKKKLRTIEGILNSSFFAYFSLLTFSSTGIEREESHDEEKFSTPFVYHPTIPKIVAQIEKLKKLEFSGELTNYSEMEIRNKYALESLDKAISSSFNLSEQELTLLDYANTVSIPSLRDSIHQQQQDASQATLTEFAQMFLTKFNNAYSQSGKVLSVEIFVTEYIVGLFFKLRSENLGSSLIFKEVQSDQILKRLHQLGIRRITDRLFVQKDVRGFERDGFYLVKPNEVKLWHKAIAYLDLNEFVEAMILNGQKEPLHV